MKLILEGLCNRCGLCCTGEFKGRKTVCENLQIDSELGTSEASFCKVYPIRKHFMPIQMVYQDTREPAETSMCGADGTPEETNAIIRKGIGKGCSLRVVASVK